MRVQTFARRHLLSDVGFAALALVCATPSFAEDLTFVWHAGTCADLFYQISKDYPDKSSIVTRPGSLWAALARQDCGTFCDPWRRFDFAMWDSQSTAEFAGGGHAYSINKVFEDSKYLKAKLFSRRSHCNYMANILTIPESIGACR